MIKKLKKRPGPTGAVETVKNNWIKAICVKVAANWGAGNMRHSGSTYVGGSRSSETAE
jgi:hypothetical protein